MDFPSKETVGLLYFLLPGFVAAWVFYALTAHPRKDAFSQIIQALIFTVIVKAGTIGVHKFWWGQWSSDRELVASLVVAVSLGVVFAVFANWDWAHRLLRRIKITKRTSYPSEWYSGFHRFRRDVILHLKGERRLKGWADEWPDQCDKGHFLIQNPAWLDDLGNQIPLGQIKRMLIPAQDVGMVEFLCDAQELTKDVDEIIQDQQPLVLMHKEKPNAGEIATDNPAVTD